MENDELLWRQYTLVESQNHIYIELVIKLTVFYFGIAGAIVSFYFTHSLTSLLCFSLLLPALVGFTFGGIFIYFSFRLNCDNRELERVATALFGKSNSEIESAINKIYKENPELAKLGQEDSDKFWRILEKDYGISHFYTYRSLDPLKFTLWAMAGMYLFIALYCVAIFTYAFSTDGTLEMIYKWSKASFGI